MARSLQSGITVRAELSDRIRSAACMLENKNIVGDLASDSIETQNQLAYDRMARSGHILAKTVTAEELRRPLEIVDGANWLGGTIRGWHVLCLAAAGGRHCDASARHG